MFDQRSNLDAVVSKYKTDGMIKDDSPMHLGSLFGIVSAIMASVLPSYLGWGPTTLAGWAITIASVALVTGIISGFIARSFAHRARSRRVDAEQALRLARKEKEPAAFLETRPEQTSLKIR